MKLGFSFSLKRAVGISAAKGKIAKATGIPKTTVHRLLDNNIDNLQSSV